VIRIVADMPAGTIGVEAVGKVTDDDYRTVLLPAIEAALERDDVRLLYVLGEDFESYSPGAMWADTKLWAQHLKAWQKVAIVSDADWLENSVKAFGWLVPGEVKVFETDDIDDAKEWLAGLDDDDDD
jgi:SpoIIAA-like